MCAWQGAAGALTLLLLVGPVAESPARGGSNALAELNGRWAGARCRIRLNVPIKKGRDGEGWSQSVKIFPRSGGMGLGAGATEYGERNAALLSVSDRAVVSSTISVALPRLNPSDPVRSRTVQGVPRGTAFIAESWGYENPKKRAGLVLNLRFARIPARARMIFRGKSGGKLNRKLIDEAERWARLELFELQAADEALVDVPVTTPAAPSSSASPSPPAATPPERSPPLAEQTSVGLRVLGVAVEPLRAAPGGEIALVVTYSLTGARAVEVLEQRRIFQGGELLTTLEARIYRQPGTHESRQTLQIPIGLAVGIYEVQVALEGPGAAADGSAIFQVIAAD